MRSISQIRSHNYLRQVKSSVVFKGLAVGCLFYSIPMMIHYLGQEQFGVWATMLSVMTWITFFDLGLGHGLRNKLTESLAKGDVNAAQNYISSAYSIVGIISLIFFFFLTIAALVVPWQKLFNTKVFEINEFKYFVLISGFFITFNFWLNLINSILNAVQKTSIVVFGQLLFNCLALMSIFILTKTTGSSIVLLATVYGFSMVSANILLTLWCYKKKYFLIPKFSLNLNHIRPLVNLGLQFFVIQIAVLIIFTTDKIIITQLYGPTLVTSYEVVFRLFGAITLVFGLITAPLWSSYTDAYHRNDFIWIKKSLRKQMYLFLLVIGAVIILVGIAKQVIKIWIGSDLGISTSLIVSMGIFIIISTWNNIFAVFLNGIGKIRIQLYTAIFAMVINIPLAICFAQFFGFGVSGIILATCASLIPFAVVGPIQVYFLLKESGA